MTPASQHFALVVASDDRLRVKLADALVSRGYVVHTSPNAEAAAALTLQVTFNVIVVGPAQLAQAPASVRALLRHDGVQHAVVFRDSSMGGDTEGFQPGVIIDSGPKDDHAARLRLLVPLAEATKVLEKKRKTGKPKA